LAVQSVAFSPDGKLFVTATGAERRSSVPGLAQLWDRASGRPAGKPLPHPNGIWAARFGPDGKTLLTAGDDGAVRRWEVATGRPVGEPLWHPEAVTALGITPDGATIVTGAADGIVRLWDAVTDRLLDARAYHDRGVSSLAVSADGLALLTAGSFQDHTVRLWEIGRSLARPVARGMDVRGKILPNPPVQRGVPPGPPLRPVAYSPDRKAVLTGGVGGLAQLWESATGRPLGTPLRHPHPIVRVVAFSPDGRQLATACQERATTACAVRLWDAATGRPRTPWLPRLQPNWVAALAFSPDGRRLAAADYSFNVHLWDTATGEGVGPPLRQKDIVLSLAFSPDGQKLAAGTANDWSADPQARLWDLDSGRPVGEPLRHKDWVVFVAFSPDGQTVVTGSRDRTFGLWDAATGKPRPAEAAAGKPRDYRAVVKGWGCAALSPEGDRLVTAGGDGAARLWGLADGAPLAGATLPHPREVAAVAVAFSPDGKLLVVGHEDGNAQLWDLATFKPLGPPAVHYGELLGVAFVPDGRSFLTTTADGTTRVWPVPAPVADPDLERLALWLEVHTGLRVGEGQAIARLTPEEWGQRSGALAAMEGGPRGWVVPPPGDSAWHEARARDAEEAGQPFTARWHLDRLIARRPADWLLYARRGRTYAEEGKWGLAEADYQQALARGSPEDVLSWYRHRAWVCQSRRQWPAALWYLDRLLRAQPEEPDLQAQWAQVKACLDKAKE
jgi:WD40 repeat protein